MKSLLDIQQDIRSLEKSIQEITTCVQSISSDIENIRNSSEDSDIDFSIIKILAQQIEFEKHPLDKLDDGKACQVYLEMLLNLVQLDLEEEITINRLVFIQWLQIQSRIDWSLEDLYKDSFKTDKKLYFEFLEIIPDEYKKYFLVDALIVANICGQANIAIYQYIADIVTIFGLSDEDIKSLALISRLVLSQSLGEQDKESLNIILENIELFRYYLTDNIVQEIMKAKRVVDVKVPDNRIIKFKWRVKQFQRVECGDIVAFYMNRQYKVQNIRASVSGTIFQFRDNNTNYGVISHENDNKDSIKAWIKTGR